MPTMLSHWKLRKKKTTPSKPVWGIMYQTTWVMDILKPCFKETKQNTNAKEI